MITIDLRLINASGMGTYLRNIIPTVIETFGDSKFNLIGNAEELQQFPWTARNNINLIDCKSPIYSIREQLEMIRKIPKDTTLFWSPHYNIPLLYRGKLLVTVYDVFHLAMPHLVGGMHKRLYAKLMFNAVCRKADAIITISHFTKQELNRLVGCKNQKIYPIHLGVAESWFSIKPTTNPHSKPYLLYVGNVKPHKNLSNLVKAFELIYRNIPHDLVIIGKKEGFITGDSETISLASKLGDRVYFTGHVNDEALKQYIVHADALIFPSFYEGFGLPPLEAMAAGCPVIVSEAASLPEVCGNAVLYCNPYRYEDIAGKIMEILNNESLRNELRSKGIAHARKFSWEKCCIETCNVISNLVANDINQM